MYDLLSEHGMCLVAPDGREHVCSSQLCGFIRGNDLGKFNYLVNLDLIIVGLHSNQLGLMRKGRVQSLID